MSVAINELKDAVKALCEVTVYLCDVCERNGMSEAEGAAISEAYKRYNEAMGEVSTDGVMAPETYTRPSEEGSIGPIPRASVIFEGQKFTFDDEDSARFAEILKRHIRKLAGLEYA